LTFAACSIRWRAWQRKLPAREVGRALRCPPRERSAAIRAAAHPKFRPASENHHAPRLSRLLRVGETRVPQSSARPSALVDTRVIYCGDNLEQFQKLPDACVDLIYVDPPFNSNRNYEGDCPFTRAKSDAKLPLQQFANPAKNWISSESSDGWSQSFGYDHFLQ